MKDQLSDKIMKFVALTVKRQQKTPTMLIKKAKGIKVCVVNRKLKFEDYKCCLEATQFENKTNHLKK